MSATIVQQLDDECDRLQQVNAELLAVLKLSQSLPLAVSLACDGNVPACVSDYCLRAQQVITKAAS